MKKFYLLIFSIISFLGISSVKAETLTASDYGSSFDEDIAFYLSHQSYIDNIIDVWEENLSMQFPYYYINYVLYPNSSEFSLALVYSDNSDIYSNFSNPSIPSQYITSANTVFDSNSCINFGSCTTSLTNFILYYSSDNSFNIYNKDNRPVGGTPTRFSYIFGTGDVVDLSYPQNLPLINHGFKFTNKSLRGVVSNSDSYYGYYNNISFPTFVSSTYNITIDSFNITSNEVFPDTVSLYNGTYSPMEPNTYTEINLNNYDYIILSLKSYTPIDTQYSTTIYVNGSLCATPVYNYGMKEKKDYYTGYQVQGCTEYYTQLTPVNFYILPQDVSNHAVYYIKSDNTYVTNIINVDNNIFDITYVTSENSNNPSVLIDGRSYPTIPYSQLTDTAIISSEQGYISGSTCALGDINCESASMGLDISDIFTNPLKVLQSVWGAITSVFLIISSFMTVLPLPLQTFLYVSFMIGFVLGIIKIIL